MAFTYIDELTRNSEEKIKNGGGLYYKENSFVYLADLKIVMEQWEEYKDTDIEPHLSQLETVDVIFEKDDGESNHDIHEITVIALKRVPKPEAKEKVKEEYYPIVALLWPSYYNKGNVQTLLDNIEGSHFKGEPFTGSKKYIAGEEYPKPE